MLLDKWYFDCVADSAHAAIFYFARLNVGPFCLPYSALLYSHEGAFVTRISLSSAQIVATGSRVTVHHPILGVEGSWIACAPPIECRDLLQDRKVPLTWHCLQPLSDSHVEMSDGNDLIGKGYLERLRLEVSPAALPIDDLYWGHFTSEHDWLVWVAWRRADQPQRLMWLNGSRVELNHVDEWACNPRARLEGLGACET
jgi:hypothetical protein